MIGARRSRTGRTCRRAMTIGSEFRYSPPPLDARTLVIAVTQSGETADTIAPTRLARERGLPDHRGHQHRRLGDHARGRRGPVPAGRARDGGRRDQDVRDPGHDAGRARCRDREDSRLARDRPTSRARRGAAGAARRRPRGRSSWMRPARPSSPGATSTRAGFMFVGRGATYPVALEGALKLKEISYVHAEGYAAGELKHGPISLLDAECPLVAVATRSSTYDKLISNVMEGRARDARVIAVATEGDPGIGRIADDVLLGARHARDPEPGAGDHPAAAVRLPHGAGPGHRRRPAAQPREVGHGRVAFPADE